MWQWGQIVVNTLFDINGYWPFSGLIVQSDYYANLNILGKEDASMCLEKVLYCFTHGFQRSYLPQSSFFFQIVME